MRYTELPGLSPDGIIYNNTALGTLEAMIPSGPYASAHAPALLELQGGDILCAWFAGSYEGSADVSIVCARLSKGSDRWTEPVAVSCDRKRSEQNPSLFLTPDGEVWVMYTAQKDRLEGKDNMQYTAVVRRQRSTDEGRTWSRYETVFPEEGVFCRQPIQILSNGRWIFGNWLCSDSASGLAGDPSVFRISDDQGATWHLTAMPESNGRVHPNVVELDNGHLTAFMRSRSADYIYRSESFDYGDSWSVPVPTSLPNNNSSISALKLQSGRIAVAYNPTSAPAADPHTAAWPGLRCPVAVALSEDGGQTFPLIRYMELGEGYAGSDNACNNLQYEYPYLMQAEDGRLHLAFAFRTRICIKWMSFSEADVMGAKRGQGVYNPTSAKIR